MEIVLLEGKKLLELETGKVYTVGADGKLNIDGLGSCPKNIIYTNYNENDVLFLEIPSVNYLRLLCNNLKYKGVDELEEIINQLKSRGVKHVVNPRTYDESFYYKAYQRWYYLAKKVPRSKKE